MPQASLPSPRTWVSGDYVEVPRLRADVSDGVAFLRQRPMFVGQSTLGTSWANNTDTNLGITAELADFWNMHNVPSSELWAQVPGWYLVRNTVAFTGAPGGTSPFVQAAGFNWTTGGSAQPTVRGPNMLNSGPSAVLAAQCCDLIEQTNTGSVGGGGDFIQPTAFQSSGAALALSTTTGLEPVVSVRWVCATTGTEPLPVPPLTTVPSPITHAWLNANVRDAINFLVYPPIAKAVYTPGSSTLASSTLSAPAVINTNTSVVDNYGGLTTGAAAKYTFPVAGLYYVYGQHNLATNATATYYAAGLVYNGGTAQYGDIAHFAPATAQNGGASVSRRLRVSAGDTVQLVGAQNSGSAIAYSGSAINQTRLIVAWVGM
jgi:hypothetical protein